MQPRKLKQPTESSETFEQALSLLWFFQEVRLLWAAWLSTWMRNFRSTRSAALVFHSPKTLTQRLGIYCVRAVRLSAQRVFFRPGVCRFTRPAIASITCRKTRVEAGAAPQVTNNPKGWSGHPRCGRRNSIRSAPHRTANRGGLICHGRGRSSSVGRCFRTDLLQSMSRRRARNSCLRHATSTR